MSIEAYEAQEEAAKVEAAGATLRLRLAEAEIYLSHIKTVRNLWSGIAIVCWLLTFGALTIVLWPYLGTRLTLEIAPAVSYVSAFVVAITAVFALISSYKAIIATILASHATLKIHRALAVQSIFGANSISAASHE